MSTPTPTGNLFGPSPLTRPIFAFGILLLACAVVQGIHAGITMTSYGFSSKEAFARYFALNWIVCGLYLIVGVFACVLAAKNKNTRRNLICSIILCILSACTVVPAAILINDLFVVLLITTNTIVYMSFAVDILACACLAVLCALCAAHAAKNSPKSI